MNLPRSQEVAVPQLEPRSFLPLLLLSPLSLPLVFIGRLVHGFLHPHPKTQTQREYTRVCSPCCHTCIARKQPLKRRFRCEGESYGGVGSWRQGLLEQSSLQCGPANLGRCGKRGTESRRGRAREETGGLFRICGLSGPLVNRMRKE